MKWIKCSEKMPADDRNVFGWKKGQAASLPIMCYYDDEVKAFISLFSMQEIYVDIDYWANPPNPPKEA